MTAGCCGDATITGVVRYFTKTEWPDAWIRYAAPGTLLLLGDSDGKCGGILRLPIQDVFVVLDAEQVWHRKQVTWPLKNDKITSFRIVGPRIEYTASR
jgi:hypothetical protein